MGKTKKEHKKRVAKRANMLKEQKRQNENAFKKQIEEFKRQIELEKSEGKFDDDTLSPLSLAGESIVENVESLDISEKEA